jgi:DNA primase
MQPPAVRAFPILDAAAALGLKVEGRRAHCFNRPGHKGGDDARPSLTFFPPVNGYKCYACGAKGDVIGLVRAVQSVGYQEAVAWLEAQGTPACGVRERVERESCGGRFPDERAIEVYTTVYENCYEIGPEMPAGKYLRTRGINPDLANAHDAVQMGEVGKLWGRLTSKFDEKQLKDAGLVSHSGRFLFGKHPLLFFYFDNGKPVYIQARDVSGDSTCKELSLAGLRSPAPFNAELLGEKPEVVYICEGCIDTLSALQLGYPAVGVPGVIGFAPEWYERFRGVSQVYLLFDNDEAGHRHAAELRSQFRMRGMKADVYHPQGVGVKDMNDLLQQKTKRK